MGVLYLAGIVLLLVGLALGASRISLDMRPGAREPRRRIVASVLFFAGLLCLLAPLALDYVKSLLAG